MHLASQLHYIAGDSLVLGYTSVLKRSVKPAYVLPNVMLL